jgi:lipid II:glycine glycyltransferase (peptidoglycan interpeptide bridge formation enzyme)
MGFHDLAVEDPDPTVPPGLRVTRSDAMRHVLDLGPFEDMKAYLASLSGSSRNKISKARRRGVEVRPAAGLAEVDVVYDLYLEAMERNHAPAWYPRELFRAIDRHLPGTDADYLLAFVDGKPAAMLAMAYSADTSHYWMGGSNAVALPAYANDLLFATAIERAIERGHRWFDFMGTRRDDEGLCQFKEKWGATRHEVGGYHVELSPLRARMFRKAYHLAKQGPLAAVVRRVRGGS